MKPLLLTLKLLEKVLKKSGEKSVWPVGVPDEFLELGGEAMIHFLARLLEISLNNASIPTKWEKTIVVPIYKGGVRSAFANYRPISLTNLFGLQANGTRYSRVFEASLG